MNLFFKIFSLPFLFLVSCKVSETKNVDKANNNVNETNFQVPNDTVYRTNDLILVKISAHTWQHISYLNTNDFGRVECNGMLIAEDGEAIVFDTPADENGAESLITYINQNLNSKIIAVIPTHFHGDCVGGMAVFIHHKVPALASVKTIEFLKDTRNIYATAFTSFQDSITLNLGNHKVFAGYYGEGHTKDNIIGWCPADSVMFGGCLIKELDATKGFLGDANVAAWPNTVLKIKNEYSQVKTIIPGHGFSGNAELLDYTIALFKK